MALHEISSQSFTWYSNAEGNMSDHLSATSTDFGSGRANTSKILGYWNAETPYGPQYYRDLWSAIQTSTRPENGNWFVPSEHEWCAFGDMLENKYNMTKENRDRFGLRSQYWTSSQHSENEAYFMNMDSCKWGTMTVKATCYVRLGTTF